MNMLGALILLAGPILGVLWLVLEFKGTRRQRITCGLFALITLATVAALAAMIFCQLDYNSSYGVATRGLIDEVIRGIESGKTDATLRELKRFQDQYRPTYENRANYVPLAQDAIERMKEGSPQPLRGAYR